jgi:hypothetical protein
MRIYSRTILNRNLHTQNPSTVAPPEDGYHDGKRRREGKKQGYHCDDGFGGQLGHCTICLILPSVW